MSNCYDYIVVLVVLKVKMRTMEPKQLHVRLIKTNTYTKVL